MSIIEVEGLSRTFKTLRAVDNISFTVDAGEIFGFLGHNGAGKTTTIRMLTGQLRPTAGLARVAGCDVIKDVRRLKPLIGVVSENQNLYERMSGRENLAFGTELGWVDKIENLKVPRDHARFVIESVCESVCGAKRATSRRP